MNLTDNEAKVLDKISAGWKTETPKHEILKHVVGDYGLDTVNTVIDKVIAAHIRLEWAELAASQTSTGIDDLHRLLWEPLRKAGFDFTVDRAEGMTIVGGVDLGEPREQLGRAKVAVDFTHPDAVMGNIEWCLEPLSEVDQAVLARLSDLVATAIVDPTAHRTELTKELERLADR